MAYIGQRMSERALEAYEMGEKPFSKWSKQDIVAGLAKLGLSNEAIDHAKTLTADELRQRALYQSSWHHTGKYYNRTLFYEIDSCLDDSDVLGWKREKKEKKKKETKIIMARVGFVRWVGVGRHKKPEEMEGLAVWTETDGQATLARVTAWASGDLRKRVDTLDVYEVYSRLPSKRTKTARGFNLEQFAEDVAEVRREARRKKK